MAEPKRQAKPDTFLAWGFAAASALIGGAAIGAGMEWRPATPPLSDVPPAAPSHADGEGVRPDQT